MEQRTAVQPSTREARGGTLVVALPSPSQALAVLAVLALALAALSVLDIALGRSITLLRQFNTGNEANVATMYASTLWLAAAVLAWAIGHATQRARAVGASRWLLLAGVFALLALDETSQLHEQTVGPLMDAAKSVTGSDTTGARLLAVGCVGLVLVAGAAWLWPWLRSLPAPLMWQLVLAGGLFAGGALGLEIVSRLVETAYLSPFEELGEMLGVSVLLAALLRIAPRDESPAGDEALW